VALATVGFEETCSSHGVLGWDLSSLITDWAVPTATGNRQWSVVEMINLETQRRR
jgi:hypothetical protein